MCVCEEGGLLAFNNLDIRHNIKIKIYTPHITINVIGRGGINLYLVQYQKVRLLENMQSGNVHVMVISFSFLISQV